MMCCMLHDMIHGDHEMQPGSTSVPQQESLLDILKRRYALGELTQAQFEEMRRTLGLSGGAAEAAPAIQAGHQHAA